MIRALITLILLSATATGLAWLVDMRGGLLVNLGPYQIETSLAVAAVGTLALAVMLAMVWACIRYLANIPLALSQYYSGRKRDKGYQAVARGMMAIGMGDTKTAERAARDAHKCLGTEPLVLLLRLTVTITMVELIPGLPLQQTGRALKVLAVLPFNPPPVL